MDKHYFRINNFDLLRLLAALQVAVDHAVDIMHVQPPAFLEYVLKFAEFFPGVPIFFFISGFLISKSFEKNHRLSEYFENRVLRLYPGLIVCVALTFLSIAVTGYMASSNAGIFDWALLFAAKTTILQFYNPDFMRAFGDGVLNGSLWTITVEIQFYFLVPIIYAIFKLKDPKKSTKIILVLIALFLIINRIYKYTPIEYHDTVVYKLAMVTFLPWFYMFLTGVLVQKNFEFFHRILANKITILFPIYCVVGYFNIGAGNNINPLVFLVLAATAFSFAYSYTSLNKKLLKGNDISYGLYIYHMPVVDFMLFSGYSGELSYAIYAVILSIGFALFSWTAIEKPSLRLKKHPLRPQKSS
jgi:peptidoglycan/LPS O-acetylase OafA/YrhL